MTTRLNPYISFRDNAREALDFYQSVLGGELTSTTFGESGMADDPALSDKIMHGQLVTPSGMWLMAADTPPGMEHTPGSSISVSLSGDDESTLRDYFDGLSAGGTVQVPFEKAPWGDLFGMFTDKFGISWLVNAEGAQA
jgi:PhnB protein